MEKKKYTWLGIAPFILRILNKDKYLLYGFVSLMFGMLSFTVFAVRICVMNVFYNIDNALDTSMDFFLFLFCVAFVILGVIFGKIGFRAQGVDSMPAFLGLAFSVITVLATIILAVLA
jgi:hypothetical protein